MRERFVDRDVLARFSYEDYKLAFVIALFLRYGGDGDALAVVSNRRRRLGKDGRTGGKWSASFKDCAKRAC